MKSETAAFSRSRASSSTRRKGCLTSTDPKRRAAPLISRGCTRRGPFRSSATGRSPRATSAPAPSSGGSSRMIRDLMRSCGRSLAGPMTSKPSLITRLDLIPRSQPSAPIKQSRPCAVSWSASPRRCPQMATRRARRRLRRSHESWCVIQELCSIRHLP